MDFELYNIFKIYKKNGLEIEEFYQIKKEELENDLKKQKNELKKQLIYSISKKEEKLRRKMEGLRQIRNIFETDDKEGMKELEIMLKETEKNFCNNSDILFGQKKELKDVEENEEDAEDNGQDAEEKEQDFKNSEENEQDIEAKKEKNMKEKILINKKRNRTSKDFTIDSSNWNNIFINFLLNKDHLVQIC